MLIYSLDFESKVLTSCAILLVVDISSFLSAHHTMENFFRDKSVQGISNLVPRAQREEIRVGGTMVVVKERLAEGGFGFVDLVMDSTNRDLVVRYK